MAKDEQQPQVNEVCRLSTGAEIKGDLTTASDIRIDGVLQGDVVTQGKLVLGENAYIKGDIICVSADIYGKVDGNITAADSTSFKSKSTFNGILKTARIAIEIGAVFNATCTIIDKAEYERVAKSGV